MSTTRSAEQEQRAVRAGALGVHLMALVLAAVLVAVGASWTTVLAVAVIAAVAGGWALKLYSNLQEQALQDRAMASTAARFSAPPPAGDFDA